MKVAPRYKLLTVLTQRTLSTWFTLLTWFTLFTLLTRGVQPYMEKIKSLKFNGCPI